MKLSITEARKLGLVAQKGRKSPPLRRLGAGEGKSRNADQGVGDKSQQSQKKNQQRQ